MMAKVNQAVKGLIKRIFTLLGFKVERLTPDIHTPVKLWELDNRFNEIYAGTATRTIVDKVRCFLIYEYAKQAESLEGDIAEIGVYKGGTAFLLAKTCPNKTIHIFDTFSGMPVTDPFRDTYKRGDFGDTTFESVTAFLKGCGNVRFYKGIFPETAAGIAGRSFSMVHVDVDIYSSVMDCSRFFYPLMARGGIIIFDDYGFPLCPGAKAAVDSFFADKPEKPVYLPTGQCVVTRK